MADEAPIRAAHSENSESGPACPVRRALEAPHGNPDMPIAEALRALRNQLLNHGLPPTPPQEAEELCAMSRTTFRGKCWKVLLGKGEISCEEYVALVREGPSHMHHKIVVDAGRTFARDHEFCRRVPPEKLTRVLNAAMRRLESRLGAEHAVYVQGMNAVCGILLLELNEVDAASAVVALRAQLCPALLCKTLDGVHAGCTLLDRALAELDPPLAAHLAGAGLSAKIFAFPWVLTLGACFPPAAEAARALDFLLGEGLHHIVLLAAARVLALRSELLATARPMQVLQRLPLLDGAGAVAGARALWPRLSAALRAEIAAFPGAGVRPGAAGTAAALEDGDGGGSE